MIKFVTYSYSHLDWIDVVEIERETDAFVWIAGRRNNKRSDWENFFDTGEEAKLFLISKAQANLDAARQAVAHCEKKLDEAKNAAIPEAKTKHEYDDHHRN